MNIAAAFNKNYIKYAIVMLTSFCENNEGHHSIYIMHKDLSEDDFVLIEECLGRYDAEIVPVYIDLSLFEEKLPVNKDWTIEIYFRLFLPWKLPDSVDRILYLDVDVIVHGSVDDLYYRDFDGMDLLAAPDSNGKNSIDKYSQKQKEMLREKLGTNKYFNSGVILLNLKQIRESYSFDTYADTMSRWNFEMTAPDQDILNDVHAGKVGYFDYSQYDLFAKLAYNDGWTYGDVKEKNKIIHFAGSKPWSFDNTRYEIERFWWEYAAMTPVYTALMESFLNDALSNDTLEKMIIGLEDEKKEYIKAMNEAKSILDKLSGQGMV